MIKLDCPKKTLYYCSMTFILDGKEYNYTQAMRILMKGQKNTLDNRKQAHSYLMWACKAPCKTCKK